jgi:hypothetical protein
LIVVPKTVRPAGDVGTRSLKPALVGGERSGEQERKYLE